MDSPFPRNEGLVVCGGSRVNRRPKVRVWIGGNETFATLRSTLLHRCQEKPGEVMSSPSLPLLNLDTYDGNLVNYPAFIAGFTGRIHENPCIPVIDKFYYLRSLLTGRAFKVIESLVVSEHNYRVALRLLESRFGNKQKRETELWNLLLQFPICLSEDLYDLTDAFDQLESLFFQLESIHLSLHKFDFLVSLIIGKFCRSVIAELHRFKPRGCDWSIALFRQAFQALIEERESIERYCRIHASLLHPVVLGEGRGVGRCGETWTQPCHSPAPEAPSAQHVWVQSQSPLPPLSLQPCLEVASSHEAWTLSQSSVLLQPCLEVAHSPELWVQPQSPSVSAPRPCLAVAQSPEIWVEPQSPSFAPQSGLAVAQSKAKGPRAESSRPAPLGSPAAPSLPSDAAPMLLRSCPPPRRRLPCLLCSSCEHSTRRCSLYATSEARVRRLLQLERCIRCLQLGHHSKDCCRPNNRCSICSQGHHMVLCPRLMNKGVTNVSFLANTKIGSLGKGSSIPEVRVGLENAPLSSPPPCNLPFSYDGHCSGRGIDPNATVPPTSSASTAANHPLTNHGFSSVEKQRTAKVDYSSSGRSLFSSSGKTSSSRQVSRNSVRPKCNPRSGKQPKLRLAPPKRVKIECNKNSCFFVKAFEQETPPKCVDYVKHANFEVGSLVRPPESRSPASTTSQ